MQTIVDPFITRLDDIERDLYKYAKEIIISDSEFIKGMLSHGQLEQGLNSYGEIVGRYSIHTQMPITLVFLKSLATLTTFFGAVKQLKT